MSGDEAANRLTALCEHFETYGEWPYNRSDSKDIADLRRVLEERGELRAALRSDADAYEAGLLEIHNARDYWQDEAAKEFHRAEAAEAEVERLKAEHARCADLYVGGKGPQVVEVSAWRRSCPWCGSNPTAGGLMCVCDELCSSPDCQYGKPSAVWQRQDVKEGGEHG